MVPDDFSQVGQIDRDTARISHDRLRNFVNILELPYRTNHIPLIPFIHVAPRGTHITLLQRLRNLVDGQIIKMQQFRIQTTLDFWNQSP